MIPICHRCPAKIPLLKIDKNVKRALCLRLQTILVDEERQYAYWLEHIRPKIKESRARLLDRKMRQQLQALRIVIWMLTPNMERKEDFPGFWKN